MDIGKTVIVIEVPIPTEMMPLFDPRRSVKPDTKKEPAPLVAPPPAKTPVRPARVPALVPTKPMKPNNVHV